MTYVWATLYVWWKQFAITVLLIVATLSLMPAPSQPQVTSPSIIVGSGASDEDISRRAIVSARSDQYRAVREAVRAESERIAVEAALVEPARVEAERVEAERVAAARSAEVAAPVHASGTVQQMIVAAAAKYGGSADYLLRIAFCESGYSPNAYNASSGASGVFQFLASTWAANSPRAGFPGASVWDPYANVNVAAWMVLTQGQAGQWQCR